MAKIDISDLKSKTENGGASAQGRLSAEDFNRLARAVEENQGAVKSITVGGAGPFLPDEDGRVEIVIAQGTSYSARLTFERSNELPVVTVTGELKLRVRYQAVMTSEAGAENANADGRLVVERRGATEQTWTRLEDSEVWLKSKNPDSQQWDEIDLGAVLVGGKQELRLHVEYDVLDSNGKPITATVMSSSKIFSVTYTHLSLKMATSPNVPLNDGGQLVVQYNLFGEVQRNLHIKVEGARGTRELPVVAIAENEYVSNMETFTHVVDIKNDTEGIKTHGVKTIEAWLTCSDGVTADAIESEHVTNQLMWVEDAADSNGYLLVQNLVPKVQNYVQSHLCEYSLFVPSGEKATKEVQFALTDYSGRVEYFSMEDMAESGVMRSISTTVEIEDAVNNIIYAYFHVRDDHGEELGTVRPVTVDNTEKFVPTQGADFVLNPKTRNNTEANPFRIINAAKGEEVASQWENFSGTTDTWVEDDSGQKVLRVLAGQKLRIGYDWLSAFKANNAAHTTLEMDFVVRNVTDETEPIISLSEAEGTGGFIGVQICPLEGAVYTKEHYAKLMQDFRFEEEQRVHAAVNIISNYYVKTDSKPLSICRVFIDGGIEREFLFDPTKSEWYVDGSEIVIGHEHADIDIYSMRVFKKNLNAKEVQNDYVATLPTSEEKQAFRKRNDIMNSTSTDVDAAKVAAIGKNVLIWHGLLPYQLDQENKRGWWEIKQYDASGKLIPELSGTICKQTASLEKSGQGTTAKTYFDWNGQTKLKDVEAMIQVRLTDLHEDIVQGAKGVDEDGKSVIKLRGCGLGGHDWAGSEAKRASGFNDYELSSDGQSVTVPDGWMDGNGKYRGTAYQLSIGGQYGQKLVNKINYASAMQSHLMGANNAYNDLHTAIVGREGLQRLNSKARVCKEQKPFYFFCENGGRTEFKGLSTFGPGKMDDATMGFDKSESPLFCMIEGSDNNLTLTDFRTPWDGRNIEYSIDTKENEVDGFMYNGEVSFDLDKCVAEKDPVTKLKYPKEAVVDKIKELVNWVYLHSPRLKVYNGSWEEFLKSPNAMERTYKWWCTGGANAMNLMRWDDVAAEWVDAGWNALADGGNGAAVRLNLRDAYTIPGSLNGRWDEMNKAYIGEIGKEAARTIGDVFVAKSLRFHYCFVNTLIAGTDNCSKNTYYILVPCADGEWRWMMSQDDMDTIFATDNSAYQNKPYYIDRLHKAADYAPEVSLYQGDASNLFDLCEAMWEENGENRAMMFEIMQTMSKMSGSVMAFFEEYFFSTQQYFCETAYNETARVRYEYPESLGYTSQGRNVHPIAQSIGRQLRAERQYMKRRLVLYASYCGFGEFGKRSGANYGGSLGIADTNDAFSFQGEVTQEVNLKGLVTHQYMYLDAFYGEVTRNNGERCVPGRKYDFFVTGALSGDTSFGLCGSNYLRSLGNLGDISVKRDQEFKLSGKRLQEVVIEPTAEARFSPVKIELNTPLIERLSVRGSSGMLGGVDLTKCVRLATVDTRDSGLTSVLLPKNNLLKTVRLGAGMQQLRLDSLGALELFSIQSYAAIRELMIRDCPVLDTRVVAEDLRSVDNPQLRSVELYGIDWQDTEKALLVWLAEKNAMLTGRVKVNEKVNLAENRVLLADKVLFAQCWGDIDSEENGLRVDYTIRGAVEPIESIAISGTQFMKEGGTYPQVLAADPSIGNDVAIDGHRAAITWELQAAAEAFATIDADGVVTTTMTDDSHRMYTLRCSMRKMDGTVLTAERNVGFWNREPVVGDFAWGDGTFGTEWDEMKDLVGLVFMKLRYPADTQLPQTGWELRVVSQATAQSVSTEDGLNTYSSFPWGLYIGGTSSNTTFTESELGGSAEDGLAAALGTTPASLGTVPGLEYKGGGGTVSDSSYLDDSNIEGGGYKDVSSNASWSDYGGKRNTKLIVDYANDIIDKYITKVGANKLPAFMQRRIRKASDIAELIRDAIAYAGNADLGWKYMQYYYPMAMVCYWFEPKHKNALNEQYVAKNWYLPALGEMCRIYNFQRWGVSMEKANENALTEARTPIFANANARRGKATFSSYFSGWAWSSSEYSRMHAWCIRSGGGGDGKSNRFYAPAVTAFIFGL